MKKFRSYEFDGARLTDLGRTQKPVIVTVGQTKKGELFALPIASYHEDVLRTYGAAALNKALRVNTSTNAGGMKEPVLMNVLTNQVGKDGQIGGGTIAVVTGRGKDAAYLAPANAYWSALVEGAEGEGGNGPS